MKGNFESLELWYNPSVIANMLSFNKLEEDGYTFMYKTKQTGDRYICHTLNGGMKFEKCLDLGFHYIDEQDSDTAVCLLNTMQQNYK